jgi:hypothetical protein
MHTLRKLTPVLAIAAASLLFVGVSAALEGEDPPSPEGSTTTTLVDGCTTADAAPCEPNATTEVDEPDSSDLADDETPDSEPSDEADEPDAGERPDNHGAAVSEAAHTCPPGPEHGACVREVARSDAGKPHADETEDQTDETQGESAPPSVKPDRGKGGQGKGRGR